MGLDFWLERSVALRADADHLKQLSTITGHIDLQPLTTSASYGVWLNTEEHVGYWRKDWPFLEFVIEYLNQDGRFNDYNGDLNTVRMDVEVEDLEVLLAKLQDYEADDDVRETFDWDDDFFGYTTSVLRTAIEDLHRHRNVPPSDERSPARVSYHFYPWW